MRIVHGDDVSSYASWIAIATLWQNSMNCNLSLKVQSLCKITHCVQECPLFVRLHLEIISIWAACNKVWSFDITVLWQYIHKNIDDLNMPKSQKKRSNEIGCINCDTFNDTLIKILMTKTCQKIIKRDQTRLVANTIDQWPSCCYSMNEWTRSEPKWRCGNYSSTFVRV